MGIFDWLKSDRIKKKYYKNARGGGVSRETSYKNRKVEWIKTFYPNGKLMEHFIIKEGHQENNRSYNRKSYYKNGKLESEETYKNNKRNGNYKSYYKNGKLESEQNYKEGVSEGLWMEYYKNGKVSFETNYKNGKENGLYKSYYENGKVSFEKNYKNGKEDGLYKSYYENGKVNFETNYKNGKENGLVKLYYKNGKVQRELSYVNGEIVNVKNYYKNGDIMSNNEKLFIIETDISSGGKKEYKLSPVLYKLSDIDLVYRGFPTGVDRHHKFKEWFDSNQNKNVIIKGSWKGLKNIGIEKYEWNYSVHYEIKRLGFKNLKKK